jgi:hypothetical protein
MQAWTHGINDVLWINHKDAEVVARVAGYIDSLDNTKPLYVNLRISDGLRWGDRRVKIQPSQIVRADPEWYQQQQETFEASIKAVVDAKHARMTPQQRKRLEEETTRRKQRSALDIMIDRACGIE